MKKNYCTWMAVWSILLGSVWVYGAEFASENVKIIQEKKSAYGAKANTILAKHLQLVAGKKLAPGKMPINSSCGKKIWGMRENGKPTIKKRSSQERDSFSSMQFWTSLKNSWGSSGWII